MLGTGTSVYSVLFYAGALLLICVAGSYLAKMLWRAYVVLEACTKEDVPLLLLLVPIAKTIVVAVVVTVALTLAWNVKQSFTTSMSRYRSPAEISEAERGKNVTPPTKEELDNALLEQRKRSEIDPHERALQSFEERMREEAEKIRRRSLPEQQ